MVLDLIDFYNIHKKKDIYILASGKSLDFIDNSFFDNKICIGVNQIYKKIIPQYLVRKENALLTKIINNNKLSNIIHFVSAGNCGGLNLINKKVIDKLPDEYKKNICIYGHNKNIQNITLIPELKHNQLFVSYSTITTAIYLAYYMGAKNIILVGHDCGLINNQSNFNNYHTDETLKIAWKNNSQNKYNNWLNNIENDTIILKKYLNSKGINVLSLNPFINYNLEGNTYSNSNNKIN